MFWKGLFSASKNSQKAASSYSHMYVLRQTISTFGATLALHRAMVLCTQIIGLLIMKCSEFTTYIHISIYIQA